MNDRLPVNEIFPTMQGEGYWVGTPATFIRLQGCDVGCAYCDTKYTWAQPQPIDQRAFSEVAAKTEASPTWAEASLDDIVPLVIEHRLRHVVITGGEPAQYDLAPLSGELAKRGLAVQLETSGTEPVRIDHRAWVTVSPKVHRPISRAAMERADEIKHPVGTLDDIEALRHLLARYPQPGRSIFLQPLSGSKKATELCIVAASKHGWRVSIQVHRLIDVR